MASIMARSFPRLGVDLSRINAGRPRVEFDRAIENHLSREMLVAELRVIDQILFIGNDRASIL